ncbi:MAG: 8-amino-7-oxononanoate synthase [Planctomycetes bacterium]|nr:8-amino-7-oxononanoate synthase [Planctomycetota bacterium]
MRTAIRMCRLRPSAAGPPLAAAAGDRRLSEADRLDLFEKCRRFDRADELRRAGLYPYFLPIEENLTEEVVIDGRRFIMIGSNNYLGLTHHPAVKKASMDAIERYGTGCTGSRFLNGTLDIHVELERRLAAFFRKEACITVSTGFQANLTAISTLAGKNDVILCDRENHASIFDGCRLSFAELRKFRHSDMEDLERQLKSLPPDAGKLIVTDGVFSMKGDLCDLPSIVRLAREHGARVMVDDAHGVGVLGANGRGTCEHFGLEDEVDVVVGTFSKSFACLGGFVAAKADVVDYVKHTGRPLIFSASMTPASAACALAALDVIESEPVRRERLWNHVERMQKAFVALGYDVAASRSAILPIPIGGDPETFRFWRSLHDEGVFANPVVSPAVPPGEGMIRTSYMATHTDEELDRVLDVFARIGREAGLLRVA